MVASRESTSSRSPPVLSREGIVERKGDHYSGKRIRSKWGSRQADDSAGRISQSIFQRSDVHDPKLEPVTLASHLNY